MFAKGEKRKLEGDKKQQSINSCDERGAHKKNKTMIIKQGGKKLRKMLIFRDP